jgi:outer membrane protein OmpA-like peptidoglycan-associated protein
LLEFAKTIYFNTSKDTFKGDTYVSLNNAVAKLKQFPSAQIVVEGHTDSIGSYENNQNLSSKRANSVRNFLIDNGIPQENIQAIGFGESKPIATNMYKGGRALNRRVVIRIK